MRRETNVLWVAWTAEIERRLEDVRSGRVATLAWEDVERDILARLRSR